MRTTRLILFAVIVASTASAAPISNITFTVFPLGDPPTYTVTALAADPSGTRVWFTDQAFVQIGFIDLASGGVTKFSLQPPTGESVLVIAGTQALVFGADGNLWFPATFGLGSATPGCRMGRFNPATGTVSYFAVAGDPFVTATQLAAGPDGNVWFTHQAESKLGRITPEGAVSSIDITTASGSFAGSIKGLAFGADGNAWVTSGFRSIFRVPPSGSAATEFRLEGGSSRSPSGITRGPNGHLYFTEAGTSAALGNKIGRITTAGVVTEWQIPTADSAPTGIVAGSDGKIYFTEQSGKQLGQLDPASGAIRESAVPDGGIPLAIVALPDGPPSPAAARHPHANGTKSGVVFNALPSNLRDGRAIWAVIDPGDLNPDPKAFVFLIENPLFGPDLDNFYETFRIGSVFFLVLQVENVSATAPTFGPIEMQSRLPDFVTEAVGGFFNAPGTCKEENRVVTCTTPKVLESGESVTALVTFQVPRPPAGAEMFSFEIFNSIKGGSDVNENNNFAGHTVYFRVDRDGGVLEKLPEIIALAIRSGRP